MVDLDAQNSTEVHTSVSVTHRHLFDAVHLEQNEHTSSVSSQRMRYIENELILYTPIELIRHFKATPIG